jgi:hypothetical protein
MELMFPRRVVSSVDKVEADMGFGRGALVWLLGVPLPFVLLLEIFWHHLAQFQGME